VGSRTGGPALRGSSGTTAEPCFVSGVERMFGLCRRGYRHGSRGDLGELSALEWLVEQGYDVYLPLGHSPDYDMIADDGDELLRVQVQTSTRHRNRRWEVMLCTRRGNQSWSGVVKLFSASRCDRLFVLVADGRQWFIPATAVEASTSVVLGGPQYAEYEVERGRPLPSCEPIARYPHGPRRGSRAVKGAWL
jgi:hypothetical protein